MTSLEEFAATVAEALTDIAKLGEIAVVRTATDLLNEKETGYIFLVDDLDEVIAVPRVWAESF
jgi:hypothetical protein